MDKSSEHQNTMERRPDTRPATVLVESTYVEIYNVMKISWSNKINSNPKPIFYSNYIWFKVEHTLPGPKESIMRPSLFPCCLTIFSIYNGQSRHRTSYVMISNVK